MSDENQRQKAEEIKATLCGIFEDLAARAASAGLQSTARDIREARLPKLQEERFSLVVLGEFNHGKSTFLNAFLKEDLLPMGATPTTAAVAEIRHGDRFAAQAISESGQKKKLSREVVGEWLRGNEVFAQDDPTDRIEIRMSSPALVDRLTVVDTPGVNDLSEQRADVTYGYVPRADAIIFLLDGTQILSASERRFLQERVLRTTQDRLIFVIGKADLLDEDERKEVETFARDELGQIVPAPAIFFVSGKRALKNPDDDATGMAALREHLHKSLGIDRQRLILDHAVADADRLVRFVRQSLAMRHASMQLPREELEQKVALAKSKLADGHKALAQAKATIIAQSAALKARIQQDLTATVARLQDSLPGELRKADAQDVQAYLAPFLQDTFSAWVQSQGTVLATTLEALAEKVVAIATEKLDAVAAELARDLNMDREAFQIAPPAMPYEASVFALGALGSTALLFVNTMMGGAVALLTPALAALVRAQALREAKEKGMKKAPELVAGVAAEISPKLDQVVDEFADKLEAFITEAGAALARGIAEVLQGALDARTGHGDEVAVDEVEAAAALRQIETTLVDLRQNLWS